MRHDLDWGHRYLVVDPAHYRIDYVINPWMAGSTVDPALAAAQHAGMVAALRAAGATVDVAQGLPDAPDMVFAMNLGLVCGSTFVASAMRHPQRQVETPAAVAWSRQAGLHPVELDPSGPRFEAGDAFFLPTPSGPVLAAAIGARTDVAAHVALERVTGLPVLPVRVTSAELYHLDLSLCPLDAATVMVCPQAWSPPSARRLLPLIPDPLVINLDEALTLCANSVVIGRTVVMPACPPRVAGELRARGFEVVVVDVSQFVAGGGAVRCLTLPLDTPGRLAALPAAA